MLLMESITSLINMIPKDYLLKHLLMPVITANIHTPIDVIGVLHILITLEYRQIIIVCNAMQTSMN